MKNCITKEAEALVGVWSEPRTAAHPIDRGIVRRFYQSVGDVNPLYWDEERAKQTKFGGMIAPALYPGFSFALGDGKPDPLEGRGADPDYTGYEAESDARGFAPTLPPVPIRMARQLNAGSEQEIYQMPRVGDLVTVRSRYSSIVQKQGKSGPLIFVTMEAVHTNQTGAVLLVSRQSFVSRPADAGDED